MILGFGGSTGFDEKPGGLVGRVDIRPPPPVRGWGAPHGLRGGAARVVIFGPAQSIRPRIFTLIIDLKCHAGSGQNFANVAQILGRKCQKDNFDLVGGGADHTIA